MYLINQFNNFIILIYHLLQTGGGGGVLNMSRPMYSLQDHDFNLWLLFKYIIIISLTPIAMYAMYVVVIMLKSLFFVSFRSGKYSYPRGYLYLAERNGTKQIKILFSLMKQNQHNFQSNQSI